MPRFLVRTQPSSPPPALPPTGAPALYIDADQEASVVAFMLSRGLPYHHLEPVDERDPLPAGAHHQRVPHPIQPPTPARRRFTLAMIGIGLALFIIAGYFFVMKAKEHLTRAPADQPLPAWQR